MPIASDHKALLFVAAIVVLGAAVRIGRASKSGDGPAEPQPALDHQLTVADSAARAGRRPKARKAPQPAASAPECAAYIFGKLDLDVATETQIEALPGIGPATARRIAQDRAERGPFVNLTGFRRVPGITDKILQHIDDLVTFSGALRPLNAVPESVSARAARHRRTKNIGQNCRS